MTDDLTGVGRVCGKEMADCSQGFWTKQNYLMTSVDDEYIRMSANVIKTPVSPPTDVTSSSMGF